MRTKVQARKHFNQKHGSRGSSLLSIMGQIEFKSALYVGASSRIKNAKTGTRLFKLYFADRLAQKCEHVDLLEVWPANIEGLKGTPPFKNLILGDARTIDEHVNQKYDLIFWWHGPEHIHEHEIGPTVEKMKTMCNKHIIFGCPWGVYEQDAVYGNPYEEHKSHLHPKLYSNLGFLTSTVSQPNHKLGNITSWMDVRWEA